MRLYYFTKPEHGLENIRRRRIKIARIKDLNDPYEFIPLMGDRALRKGMREMKRLADSEYGIVCFTSSWEHPMMWSHYADRHRGVCLGFDVVSARPIIPIEYTPHLLAEKDFKVQQIDDIDTLDYMRTWFVKFDSWAYEAEKRMVFQLDQEEVENGLYFHRFEPALRLAEVVVGAESDITRDQVTAAIGDLQNVELTKARLAFQRFAVVKQHQESMWKKTEDLDPEHAM
ncbi:hypothetical protein BJF92_13795 [Rhizobium rhizosphaerae]|uniref:DUF2971 domain-containing protein n=1 Tax=Xaviernesmea rhizosphaerae TaxID=1672749 RepID=A0A1Q9AI38_9HYPH|nr:DUF2971 domain-containing protein [Xaviernesmea rhizosphaerae]OLP54875.1 hypothetical protein BJF92_13795 [Xaviernesmea rhizosphaerae]